MILYIYDTGACAGRGWIVPDVNQTIKSFTKDIIGRHRPRWGVQKSYLFLSFVVLHALKRDTSVIVYIQRLCATLTSLAKKKKEKNKSEERQMK